LLFLVQSVVVGLAVAFVIVVLQPDLLPTFDGDARGNARSAVSYADAVEISAPAVANVYTRRLVQSGPARDAGDRYRPNISLGSAVVIDPAGYLVTNYHVVADADEIRVQLADGRIAGPEVVGVDAETDLALLKVDLGPLPAVPLGSSQNVRIGDVVLAIGNPYGLAKTVTQGIVSATGRGQLELTTYENFIQTDAAINDGNSGGALVNTLGELVGINTAVLAQDAGTEGISFAIPVDLVRGVVDEIKRHGRVIRGWVGLETDELSSAESEALGLEPNIGLLLTSIIDGGPAETAGLKPGDVILSINGEPIRNAQQARLLVAALEPGDQISLDGWRNGQRFTARLTAAERPPN
ncbi:MAG TPA: trypsin-like peptidase domain-containing protein, partial [Woeseiaceae bacterium]|nr:trypsin-like peptidase domain-containing protein [Woeseiaceae bacterium]